MECAIQSGSFGNSYDPGFKHGLDLEYSLGRMLSALADLQFNNFEAAQSSFSDTQWWSLTGGLKYIVFPNAYKPYVAGGAGLYIPDQGSTESGVFFEWL